MESKWCRALRDVHKVMFMDRLKEKSMEFKVGDKVTSVSHGRGEVVDASKGGSYPVRVEFDSGYESFTCDGRLYKNELNKILYYGHGEIEIKFTLDKEPEYEYQWLYRLAGRDSFSTSIFYKTEDDFKRDYFDLVVWQRIEESKRLVK